MPTNDLRRFYGTIFGAKLYLKTLPLSGSERGRG
jgi:hypothetical protein